MLSRKKHETSFQQTTVKIWQRCIVVCILLVVLFSSVLSAQGRRDWAFEHVRKVQERNTKFLMSKKHVEGTAIGLNQDEQPSLIVLTTKSEIDDIPEVIDNVPVQIVVSGKIYPFGKGDKENKFPKAPTHLTATVVDNRQIRLNWNRNRRKHISGYNVYRSEAGGPYNKILSLSSSTNEYFDEGLIPSTTYYYIVTTFDESNNESSDSEIVQTKTESCSEEPPIGPRPAPIGISTGHPNITAGTIGCRVKDAFGNVYALSNNHVYADENRADIGDFVLQPGTYDGGENPRDFIGMLFDYEPIVFSWSARNTIDAAIIITSMDLLGNSTPSDSYGIPSSKTADPYIGLRVQKHGRTTGRTYGTIVAINATVYVYYDTGIARFIRQMIISPGDFAYGGDSGSLIVTQQGNHPVGLLFAGNYLHTVANPIDDVLDTFGIMIDGQ